MTAEPRPTGDGPAAGRHELAKERIRNADRINLLRLWGVSVFFLLFLVLGGFLRLPAWRGNLGLFAIYWSLTVAVFLASRRFGPVAPFTTLTIGLLDVPMAFFLQWATLATSPSASGVAGFTVGVYVLLVILSALSLQKRYILFTATIGAAFEILLQHFAGVSAGAMMSTVILLGLAASACSYSCRRLVELVERVESAERQRAELGLRQSEDHFRALIENASDIFTVITPDGTIRYQSPSVEWVLEYGREGFVGRQVFEFIHPDDLAAARAAMETMFAGRATTRSVELRLRHRNGSWRPFEVVAKASLDKAGQSIAILTSRDLSERRRVEEQLRQSQRMEAVGQLAGGIAHDFNNMLTVILGRSDLLLTELGATQERQRSAVELIRGTAARAASLTHQILAFSRKQVLQPKVLELNDQVAGLEEMLRRLIGEHITLSTELRPDSGSIWADPGQIEQVIMNLVVNARDAMASGGSLTIETDQAELGEEVTRQQGDLAPETYAALVVRDTGVGMDAATLARAFEPFFTTKPMGKGTGLGLSTVYGIVKQSGGHIEATSSPGEGTQFTIYLPRVNDRSEAEAVPGRPTTRGSVSCGSYQGTTPDTA